MKKGIQLGFAILFFMSFSLTEAINASISNHQLYLTEQSTPATTNNCVDCHKKNQDEVVGLFAQSTHARRQLSCEHCHGGEASAKEKSAAHARSFIARPTGSQVLEMCSTCHQSQFAAFKTGKHLREDGNTPRVDCVQCHGAHLIGSPSRKSEFALLCSNCHGLEYIPELPDYLRQILSANDEVKNALNELQSAGRKPSDSLVNKRRELRKRIAEIVHPTDAGVAKIQMQSILDMSNALKLQIQNEKR
jgi:hypothetical protein